MSHDKLERDILQPYEKCKNIRCQSLTIHPLDIVKILYCKTKGNPFRTGMVAEEKNFSDRCARFDSIYFKLSEKDKFTVESFGKPPKCPKWRVRLRELSTHPNFHKIIISIIGAVASGVAVAVIIYLLGIPK